MGSSKTRINAPNSQMDRVFENSQAKENRILSVTSPLKWYKRTYQNRVGSREVSADADDLPIQALPVVGARTKAP